MVEMMGVQPIRKSVYRGQTVRVLREVGHTVQQTIVFLLLGISFLFYLSFACVYWLVPLTGTGLAFFIVALFFLVLLALVYFNRKAWIERPLVRFLSDVLLN